MLRLPDALLDDCRCRGEAPLARSPSRHLLTDKHAAKQQLAELKPWLSDQLTRLRANRQPSLLLVLQGPDCSGKDGVIRRVLGGLDPLGLSICSFNEPDPQANRLDFLARYRARLPQPGQLAVFNRSYYEGLTSDLWDGLCTPEQCPQRLARLLALEAELPRQGIHLLKCYLQISHEEQTLRLRKRIELPSKRWKLKASDLPAWREFAGREQQWAETLRASDSDRQPWYVIPADHRWQRDLLLASLLARTFETLKLEWPDRPPPFPLAALGHAQ